MIFAKQRHTGLARQGLGHQGLSRTWRDGEGPLFNQEMPWKK